MVSTEFADGGRVGLFRFHRVEPDDSLFGIVALMFGGGSFAPCCISISLLPEYSYSDVQVFHTHKTHNTKLVHRRYRHT